MDSRISDLNSAGPFLLPDPHPCSLPEWQGRLRWLLTLPDSEWRQRTIEDTEFQIGLLVAWLQQAPVPAAAQETVAEAHSGFEPSDPARKA